MIDMFQAANTAATRLREFYDAYVRAGFSEDQAFTLTENLQQASLSACVIGPDPEGGPGE